MFSFVFLTFFTHDERRRMNILGCCVPTIGEAKGYKGA